MDAFRTLASAQPKNADRAKFWEALDILLQNPHLVNRRIAVSSEIVLAEALCDCREIREWVREADATSVLKCAEDGRRCADLLNINKQRCNYEFVKGTEGARQLHDNKSYLRLAKLMPRNGATFSPTIEIALIDRANDSVTFFYVAVECQVRKSLGHAFQVSRDEEGQVRVAAEAGKSNLGWLKEHMLPKLLKWIENEKPSSFLSGSLKLVPPERYALRYEELKKKYGPEMVAIWPESTDPAKFVYEDVAIATYLLLLWERERGERGTVGLQSFVDLGCGNGLLVHILAGEGHPGLGIDLRRRKIWDLFPGNTKLEVRGLEEFYRKTHF